MGYYQNPQSAGNTIWGAASKGLEPEDNSITKSLKQGIEAPGTAAKGGYSMGQEALGAAGMAGGMKAGAQMGATIGGPYGAIAGAAAGALIGSYASNTLKGDPKTVAQAPTDAAQGMQLDVSSPVLPGQQPQQQAQMAQAPLGPPPGQFNRDEYLRRFGGYSYG